MKRAFNFVFAAVAILSVASCAKEFAETPEVAEGNKTTIRFSFGEAETRTALDAGKTVWEAGDSILVTDGTNKIKVCIPSSYAGTSSAEIDVDMTTLKSDTLYAVYPPQAFKSVSGGKVSVDVANDQSGNFNEANICVAKATDYMFSMKNATAVLKIRVAEDIETVMISASNADTLAGTVAVNYTDSETPLAIATTTPRKAIKVTTGGLDGDYYVAIVPGKYAEFSVMALTLTGKSQKKVATGKSLAINDLADLGVIGDDLSGSSLDGEGTETDPFLIKDLADITTLATTVNSGLSYKEQYFQLTADIEGVSTPVGTFDQVIVPFQGIFDGANHTVTLAMDNAESSDAYMALFGAISDGAVIKDVTVNGTVATKGSYVSGVVAYATATAEAVSIEGCTNAASVKGNNVVAGVDAYANAGKSNLITVTNCHNTGDVTSTGYTAGGVVGYVVNITVSDSNNTGAIESKTRNGSVYTLPANAYKYADFDGSTNAGSSGDVTRGTGGIAGILYNSTAKNCTNSGTVTAVSKAGGISGNLYWATVANSTNTAAVTTSNDFAGGLVGTIWVNGTVKDSQNSGAVTAKACAGGIVGLANAQERSSSSTTYMTVTNNVNTGAVEADKDNTTEYSYGQNNIAAAGGIVGAYKSFNYDFLNIVSCVNEGDVHGVGQAVGGILGYMGNPRNGSDQGKIDMCVNKGDVSSDLNRAGGIAGLIFDRFTTCRYLIRNCENEGSVTAPVAVGGLVGNCTPAYPANDTDSKFKIYNCVNRGEVAGTSAIEKTYVGGLLGYCQQIDIKNCYNEGEIVLPDGTPTTSAGYTGLLFGQTNAYNNVRYCYSGYDMAAYDILSEDGASPAGILYGTAKAGTTSISDVYMVNDEGSFDFEFTVGTTTVADPVSALNAWVAAQKTPADYYTWGEGPVFVK